MKKLHILIVFLFLFALIGQSIAQDSIYIKVHFLYGSKPKWAYRDTEKKWFGGKLGGHVGIEIDSNKILNFLPYGDLHYVAHKKDLHSSFDIHTRESFWKILGARSSAVKKMTIIIPITKQQKLKLDSLTEAYTHKTPYDYAFIGMRCGAAAYDILSQLNILKQYSHRKTYMKIFYPRKLRRRLMRKAIIYNWLIVQEEGSKSRKWERD
ncbi:MAG: hypothetical protein HYZ42_11300 [Bacteroidetes bacterium]|nr:hypothetical protein [Bacteroidota bacterium]